MTVAIFLLFTYYYLYNIYTTSAQHLRRWSNAVQMLYKCFAFIGSGLILYNMWPRLRHQCVRQNIFRWRSLTCWWRHTDITKICSNITEISILIPHSCSMGHIHALLFYREWRRNRSYAFSMSDENNPISGVVPAVKRPPITRVLHSAVWCAIADPL